MFRTNAIALTEYSRTAVFDATLKLFQQHTASPSLRSGLPSPATTTKNEVPVAHLFRFSRPSHRPALVANTWTPPSKKAFFHWLN